MGVFKYTEDTDPKPNVASDSDAREEAEEERKDSKAPAPASVNEDTYADGEESGGNTNLSGVSVSNYSGSAS